MFREMLENVREKSPLIHNITNYVTVNDCANIVIACGAAPIMADEPLEVEEITEKCTGLNINMGTLNSRTVESMLLAGKRANALGHTVVFDPVGVGVSKLRMETARKLLNEVKFTTIRGNISEIKTLASGRGEARGVDAGADDLADNHSYSELATFAKNCSRKLGSVIAITGKVDVVADQDRAILISNGHAMMASVTGTGCMLSAMVAAYVAGNEEKPLEATAAAIAAMGLAGQIAYERLSEADGNSSYRNYIIDAIYRMTPEELEKGAKYEIQ